MARASTIIEPLLLLVQASFAACPVSDLAFLLELSQIGTLQKVLPLQVARLGFGRLFEFIFEIFLDFTLVPILSRLL